jgi:hypothetical protein
MKLTKTVQIVTLEPQYSSTNGTLIGESDVVVKQFMAEIQPYSSSLAEKQYGVITKVTNRMFCNPVSELTLGSYVKENNLKYRVNALLDFDKHDEVLLELVVNQVE